MFWLSNMKQLNFGHFNTDSNFFPEQNKNKNSSKFKANIICFLVKSRSFRQFSDNSRLYQKISKDYRRFPKTGKDFQRWLKMSEDCWRLPRRNRKFSTLYLSLISHVKDIFCADAIFSWKPIHTLNTIFSGNRKH